MSSDTIENARKAFIGLAVRCNVLRFGEFELKSGRLSPYFFKCGGILHRFGARYARSLLCRCHRPLAFAPRYLVWPRL